MKHEAWRYAILATATIAVTLPPILAFDDRGAGTWAPILAGWVVALSALAWLLAPSLSAMARCWVAIGVFFTGVTGIAAATTADASDIGRAPLVVVSMLIAPVYVLVASIPSLLARAAIDAIHERAA